MIGKRRTDHDHNSSTTAEDVVVVVVGTRTDYSLEVIKNALMLYVVLLDTTVFPSFRSFIIISFNALWGVVAFVRITAVSIFDGRVDDGVARRKPRLFSLIHFNASQLYGEEKSALTRVSSAVLIVACVNIFNILMCDVFMVFTDRYLRNFTITNQYVSLAFSHFAFLLVSSSSSVSPFPHPPSLSFSLFFPRSTKYIFSIPIVSFGCSAIFQPILLHNALCLYLALFLSLCTLCHSHCRSVVARCRSEIVEWSILNWNTICISVYMYKS